MKTNRFKKVIAAGMIGVTALGATAVVPYVAEAQQAEAPSEDDRAERRAARETRRAEKVAVLTDALGLDAEQLQAARDAGQSIADIAADNGVPLSDVVDALVAHAADRIQSKVVDGRLTQAEADEKIAALDERITERLNRTPGDGSEGDRGPGRRGSNPDAGSNEPTGA